MQLARKAGSLVRQTSQQEGINIVSNWFEALKERVPVP
jgi:hypothetical protein